MQLKLHFDQLARYNQWMNARLYEAASRLGEADLHADKGAFFGSVFATLDHLLVADTIWMKRFLTVLPPVPAAHAVHALPHPYALSSPLHPGFEALRQARAVMDGAIVECFAAATEDTFDQVLVYTNRVGERSAKPLVHVVAHFFNHQTHHRGQVTTLLSQAGIDMGVTDLLVLAPDVGEM